MRSMGKRYVLLPFLCLCMLPSSWAAAEVTLESDLPIGQPSGTTVTWTVSSDDPAPQDYRLRINPYGEPVSHMWDFRADGTFAWTPLREGVYVVKAAARNRETGVVEQTTGYFWIHARVLVQPLVTLTDHPLVAHYSAPTCATGNSMRVLYMGLDELQLYSTDCKPCKTGRSMNFYVGGLRPEAVYAMVHLVQDADGEAVAVGPVKWIQSGPMPIVTPRTYTRIWPGERTSLQDNLILMAGIMGTTDADPFPYATDMAGLIRWYYDSVDAQLTRPVAGGKFLVAEDDWMILREIDLPGNVVRETTVERINQQLAAVGQDQIVSFHHEARILPDGRTAVLAYVERILEDVQGEGPVDILGDMVLVLDENWQVVWTWNAFDHMDVSRPAVLGETCAAGSPGCPLYLTLADTANDWLHCNAVAYSESDGNLIVSVRHQDWIVKVDYRNGLGDGHVIWRLGREGDFALNADPTRWFSHQHDPNFVAPDRISVYDNGNTRCQLEDECESAGQVYTVVEEGGIALLDTDAPLQNYSMAVGSSQPLLNGNYHFCSGVQTAEWYPYYRFSTMDEVLPDGTMVFSLETRMGVYRSFRMTDLYTPPITDPQGTCPGPQ